MAPKSSVEDFERESKRLRFDNEHEYEGARAATDYAVKAIYATQGLTKGKREYLNTVDEDLQSNIVWEQMLPGFKLFLGNKEWSYDDLEKLASTPSRDLASFKKAGVYLLIARDPKTGECMIYVGSTGCLLVRFESHITEVMKGLAGKHYEPKKFYKWCVEHEVVPECVIALFDDTEEEEPHFNEFAEACIMSMVDAFTDEACHYGGQSFHARAARTGDLPEDIPWEGGNACWPVMMPNSTFWPGEQNFEEKQCGDCDFKCFKDGTLAAHMRLKHQKDKYSCSFCDESFSHAGEARDHTAEMHKGVYQCPNHECDKSFGREKALKVHIGVHTRPYSCEVCGRDFSRTRLLKYHMHTHADDLESQKPYMCRHDGCDKRYGNPTARNTHEKTCGKTGDEAKPYECSNCSATFTASGGLHTHKQTCGKSGDEARLFKCSNCSATFTRYNSKDRHEKTCGKDGDEAKPYKCSNCSAAFARNDHKDLHEKTCGKSGDEARPFKCSNCPATFTRKRSKDLHEKTCGKTGDEARPFKCSNCPATFIRNHHRDAHEETCGKTGDEARPYKCSNCPTTFSRKDSKNLHEKTCGKTGDEAKPYKCSNCPARFQRKDKCTAHEKECLMTDEEKKPFKCSNCESRFKTKDQCAKHELICGEVDEETLRAMPFKCNDCPKRYKTKKGLSDHQKFCGKTGDAAKPFKCDDCNRGYPRKHDLAAHKQICGKTGDEAKPHKCDECDKRFPLKRTLAEHKTKMHKKKTHKKKTHKKKMHKK